ncbi:hypothetical protein Emag_007318 [Eimeria magna]
MSPEQQEAVFGSASRSLADPFSALGQANGESEGSRADELDVARGRQENLQSTAEESLNPQMEIFMNNVRKLNAARREACEGFLDEDGRIKPEIQRSKVR